MAKNAAVSTALLAMLLISRNPAAAAPQTFSPFPAGTWENTFLLGYGITHRGFGETRTEVQTVDFIPRIGYFHSGELGAGWYRGQFEHVLELPLHLAVDPKVRIMTGGNLLARWNFTGVLDKGYLPYVFAGGGVLYVDLGLPTMGSRLNYTYGGGTGVHYLLRKDLSVSGEYRYHHISNANTAQPNEPLNSSKFLLGITLFR